jgi:DNA replication protein DnaC
MIPTDDLDGLFKRLSLANARRVWRDLVQRAERERWSYQDFLTMLAVEEIAHRQQTRLARLTRWAHFPFLKTIDDFNFTYQSALRLTMLGSALSPDFVTEGRSLILMGKPGRGKTHLAIAIAYRAIQNGFDARFTTAATLIDDLSAAFRAGQLADALSAYTHPAVLVVDEVGYLTYGTDAANMLFHVVNDRHRRNKSMIFTTNKGLKAWGRVLHDDDLAQAIIDRVLERGRLIRLDGPSVRTLHLNLDEAMKEGSDQDAEVARISGNRWPEFPEPTTSDDHIPYYMRPVVDVWRVQGSTKRPDGKAVRWLWEPDPLDQCYCGGRSRFGECCRQTIEGAGDSARLHSAWEAAVATSNWSEAERVGRAALAQYVIWIRRHTAPTRHIAADLHRDWVEVDLPACATPS